jgi:hypothetical protein
MWLFFSALLFIGVLLGLYIYQRDEPGGILSPAKLTDAKRLQSALWRVDDWAGALVGIPLTFPVLGGLFAFVLRMVHWIAGTPADEITLQRFAGLPATPIATGFSALDDVVSWFVTTAPLELWLIFIWPAIWFAALTVPSMALKRFSGQGPSKSDSTNNESGRTSASWL